MQLTERLQKRAKQLKTDVPAAFLAMKDPETPFLAKAVAALAVCYALSPVDLIPDFVPVLGYLDDILILPALVALTVRLIPAPVWARCRSRAAGLWENGRPKSWRFALPILLVWAAVLLWLAAKLWSLFA